MKQQPIRRQLLRATLIPIATLLLTGCIAPRPVKHQGVEKAQAPVKTQNHIHTLEQTPTARLLFAYPGPRKLYVDKDGNEFWQGRAGVGKFGGALRMAEFGAGPKTFNGWDTNDVTSHGIGLIQNESLVDYDPWTGKPIPRLAKSYTISPDGKTVRFVLRKGLKWSDGQPLDADDVVFTYGKLVKEAYGDPSHRDTLSVTGDYPEVKKIDNLTIDFVFKKPFAPFLYNLNAVMVAPRHVLDPITNKAKDDFHNFWTINCDPKTMVGSGPFILERYVIGQRYELKRNPYFSMVDAKGQKLPYLDRITISIVPEQNTEIMKFLGGELDLLDVKSVRGQDANMLKHKEKTLDFTLYNLGPDDGTYFLLFNLSRRKNPKTGKYFVDPIKAAWFNDLNFRRAVNHAINRRSVINNVLKGVGYPLYTCETPASLYFNPALKAVDFNLDEAARLLSQSGFVKKDGILYDAKGNAVEFDLTTNSGNSIRDAVCIIIKEDLKKLGIKVKYQPMEFNAMIDRVHQSLQYETVMMGLSGSRFEPYGGANVWKSDARRHSFDCRQSKDEKTMDMSDVRPWEKEIDACLDGAAGTYDEAERRKLYNRFQQIVYDEQPMIYIYTNVMLTAAKNNVGNYRPTPFGSVYYTPKGSMYNLEEIYLKGDH